MPYILILIVNVLIVVICIITGTLAKCQELLYNSGYHPWKKDGA
jgi:hypothetical protein